MADRVPNPKLSRGEALALVNALTSEINWRNLRRGQNKLRLAIAMLEEERRQRRQEARARARR